MRERDADREGRSAGADEAGAGACAVPAGPMTVAGFVDWALALPDPKRWELTCGRPARRPRATVIEVLARGALLHQLGEGRRDDAVLAFGSGTLVVPGPDTALDPPVVLAPRAGVDPDSPILDAPLVIGEVLPRPAPAAEWVGRLRAYTGVASVRHVVAVEPRLRLALHLRRADAGPASGTMTGRVLRGGRVDLAPTGVALNLDQLWARLDQAGFP